MQVSKHNSQDKLRERMRRGYTPIYYLNNSKYEYNRLLVGCFNTQPSFNFVDGNSQSLYYSKV